MMGKAYYQSPVSRSGAPVPAAAPPQPPPRPQDAPLRVDLGQAIIDPGTASAGDDVTFRQDITVNTDATLLVDFELWDSENQKVWQIWHDNQPLRPGTILTDAAVMTIPDDLPAGRYTFVTGVFSAGWGTMFAWNANAGSLMVAEAVP
jgi:hypothetical protein